MQFWIEESERQILDLNLEEYQMIQERISLILDLRRQLQFSPSELEKDKTRKEMIQILEASRKGVTGFVVPRNHHGQTADVHNTAIVQLLRLVTLVLLEICSYLSSIERCRPILVQNQTKSS